MTSLRRIHSWLPLLRRACTQSCQRAAPTNSTTSSSSSSSCTSSLLHTAQHAAAGRRLSSLHVRTFALSAGRLKNTDDFITGLNEEEEEDEEDEDFIGDEEVEELFQQQAPSGIGEGQHRVFIVHPDVKWGSRKQHLTTGNRQVQVWVCGACWEILYVAHFYCFLCSRADDGRGCGAREHSGQLESGGQDHHVHQDTREEEDLWQRQLPGSHRWNSLCVHLWICPESVRMWLICAFCLLLLFLQRESGKQQESLLCLWMSSVCLLCLRWAYLKNRVSVCLQKVFIRLWLIFIHAEGAGGSLGD